MYIDPYMQKAMLLDNEDPNATMQGMPTAPPQQAQPQGMQPQGMMQPFQADPRLAQRSRIMTGLSNIGQIGGNAALINPFQQQIDANQKLHMERMKGLQRTQNQMAPSSVREYEYLKTLSDEDRELYFRNKRGDQRTAGQKNTAFLNEATPEERTAFFQQKGYQTKTLPDGSVVAVSPDGQTTETLWDANSQQQGAADMAGGVTTATKSAEQVATDMARLREIAVGGVTFKQTMQQIDGWLGKLEGGDLETGLVKGFLTELNLAGTELEGEALADSVEQALLNLQITNLAPVTEKEIEFIKGLFMDLKSPTEVNIGKLKGALKRMQRAIEVTDYEAQGARDYILEFGDARQQGFVNQFFPTPTSAEDALTKQGL